MSQKVVIASKNTWTTVGHNSLSGTRRTVRLVCAKADAETVFASLTNGARYATLGSGTGTTINVGGYFDQAASSVTMGEAYATLSLIFDSQSSQPLTIGSGTDSNRYDPVYSLSTATDERSIEQHPNFLCKWAYNLYELIATGGTPSALPAWADTDNNPAGGTRAAPVAREPQYVWSRTQPTSPDADHYYQQVLPATDFGMDTYLVPRPVVTSTIYYKDRNIKNSDIIAVGKLKKPAETYIYGTSATQWLVVSGDIQDASETLVAVTTSYQYAEEGYKTKVYTVAS